jgi:3-phenylpropionate/trans-cinnamate dioxygenase ferredoxin component
MPWVRAASRQTIRAGAARRMDLNGTRIALFNVDGTFYAIDDECPHEEGGSLSKGTVEHGSVWCPLHGARFALATGQTLEPPEGDHMGPPVDRGVRVYPVTLRGDDIYVGL